MNITSFAIGSYGDVKPFIILGKELKRRGYNFTIVTFTNFKEIIEENDLEFRLFHGSVEEMMSILLSESDGALDSLRGIKKLLKKNTLIYDDIYSACKDADAIIYMQFGALAYHFAEKMGIACIRTFVFPYDPTKLYAPMFTSLPRNTLRCKLTYYMSDIMMNWASKDIINIWRKRMGLKKWHLFSSYKKINNRFIPTLYQYSQAIAPRDPKWGEHIHITGPWLQEEEAYIADKELEEFLKAGDLPIYIGFGSMVYKKMPDIQKKILDALKRTGQRAILVSSWSRFKKDNTNTNVYYSDFIPFSWLFPRVKGIVNHGGSGTVSLGLKFGKPVFIMAFGADQMFWGTQINELRVGPKPIDVTNEDITVDVLESRFLELEKEEYMLNAQKISEKLQEEKGYKRACDIIEDLVNKQGGQNG